MRVCDVIRADLESILDEWAATVTEQVIRVGKMPPPVLRDEVPALLQELAQWLESEGKRPVRAYWEGARRHAMDRLGRDFDLAQVIHEYRILRCVILRRLVAVSREGRLDDLADLERMDEALDLAIAVAVDRFSKAREQMLSAEAERSRLALEAGAIGMWEWAPRTGALRWDERTRALFGVPAGMAVDYDMFLAFIHPEDRARIDTYVQEKARSAHVGDDLRLEFRLAAGDRWIESRGSVLDRDEQGYAARVLGTALEITGRKRRERESERTAEFRERFIGIVSHDLRNPLHAIRVGATLLINSEELPQAPARIAGRIVANADRMSRMIGELLDLTRGRFGGGIPVEPRPTNLRDIAANVVENQELLHPGRQIVSEARGCLDGRWDPDRMSQALGNLVSNALDHGAPDAPVRIDLVDEGDRVAVSVHNEGAPISREEQEHLFEPFRRGPAPGPGLGLGLYIASEIARAHHGGVSVESTAREGTTFRLTVPRCAA